MPLQGTVSAQKAPKGSKAKMWELLLGIGEKNILPYDGALHLPSRILFTKGNIELVAKPGGAAVDLVLEGAGASE